MEECKKVKDKILVRLSCLVPRKGRIPPESHSPLFVCVCICCMAFAPCPICVCDVLCVLCACNVMLLSCWERRCKKKYREGVGFEKEKEKRSCAFQSKEEEKKKEGGGGGEKRKKR